MSESEAWILVVDDTFDACDVLRRLLIRMGHDTTCVHSGAEALVLLLHSKPCSLVLLDLNMPEMSGFDVMRAIQADPDLWKTPVVICSASDRATYWPELRSLGARDFIMKAEKHYMSKLGAILQQYVGAAA